MFCFALQSGGHKLAHQQPQAGRAAPLHLLSQTNNLPVLKTVGLGYKMLELFVVSQTAIRFHRRSLSAYGCFQNSLPPNSVVRLHAQRIMAFKCCSNHSSDH